MKKNGILVGIFGVIIIGLIVFGCYLYGNLYKSPINNYFKGIQKADLNVYAKAFPDFMNVGKISSKEGMEESLNELKELYGDDVKIKYEINEKIEYSDEDLKKIVQYIKDRYNKSVKVSKGYCLKIKVLTKGSKNSNEDNVKMYVYKIDGKWKYIQISPENAQKYVENK